MAKLIGRAGNFNIKIKRIYQNATIDVKKKRGVNVSLLIFRCIIALYIIKTGTSSCNWFNLLYWSLCSLDRLIAK